MKKRNVWIVKGVMAALFIAAVILLWKYAVTREQVSEAVDYIRSFGVWSVIVYFFAYTALVALSFPSTILNIASGILFGLFAAITVSILAAFSGACTTFLFARYWLKERVKHKLERYESSKEVLSLAKDSEWRLVVLLRLNPFIPAVLKNYGFGITEISFKQYAWATLIGQLPLVSLYTYLGWVGGNSMLNSDAHPPTYQWAILGGGLLVSIIVTYVAYRHTKKKQHASATPA
jgi:uncharacterized membrane protein YdjX (TVP38/TMEM64 family)